MRPWLPVCALLALGCASNPSPTDAGTDTAAPLDSGTAAPPPEDRPAALDVVAVDTPDVRMSSDPVPLGDVVDASGGEDAPDAVAVAVADVPALDAPDVVTADTPDVAVAVADVVDAGPVCDAMLDSDYTNCGACGVVCGDRPNAVGVCRAGACTTACRSSFADCDGDPSNGCETSIINNASNCGACGRACGSSQICVSNRCDTVCAPGVTNCSGACVELSFDINNCGVCGRRCEARANSSVLCNQRECVYSCDPGFVTCGPTSFCAVNLSSDPTNCGVCGNRCPSGQRCLSGSCRM